MPDVQVSLMELVWEQLVVLLLEHPEGDPGHPFGCHRHPPAIVATGGNHHDSPLLAGLEAWSGDPTDTTVHLDRGYDSTVTRMLLANLALPRKIAHKGEPAPLQVGNRRVVKRTYAWMNGYGKLRRWAERVGLAPRSMSGKVG